MKTKFPNTALVYIPFMPRMRLAGEQPWAELMEEIEKAARRYKKPAKNMSATFEVGTFDPIYGRTFTAQVTYHRPSKKK